MAMRLPGKVNTCEPRSNQLAKQQELYQHYLNKGLSSTTVDGRNPVPVQNYIHSKELDYSGTNHLPAGAGFRHISSIHRITCSPCSHLTI